METRIEEIFDRWANEQKVIGRGDNVIIGVSGGPDSLCLLFLMYQYSKRVGFSVSAVHFNHKVRGAKADEDEAFVKEVCDYLKIKCIIARADIPALAKKSGLSVEETGRIMRYKAFAKAAQAVGGVIAVAHHMDDNVETVLLNLARGSSVKGLTGMQEVGELEGCTVIRPLIKGTHAQIMEFLDSNQLRYMEDETNLDLSYARNRIRHNVIPELKEVNPKASEHIAQAAEELAKVEEFLSGLTEDAYSSVVSERDNELIINTYKLLQLDPVIQGRVAYQAIGKALGTLKDVSKVHVDDLLALCRKQTGRQIDLPGELIAVKNYYDISIRPDTEEDDEPAEALLEIPLDFEELYQNTKQIRLSDGTIISLLIAQVTDENRSVFLQKNEYTKAFDYDTISGNLVLGRKASGDVICLKDGSKKLKKFFIDEKIPKDQRNDILVIKDEKNVLWILGYRIGEDHKITEETKLALLIGLSGGSDGDEN